MVKNFGTEIFCQRDLVLNSFLSFKFEVPLDKKSAKKSYAVFLCMTRKVKLFN